jgi:hypothetical protein
VQFVILHILLCAIVGYMGRHRQIGFWGFFVMAMFTLPSTAFLWLAVSTPRYRGNAGSGDDPLARTG